MDRGGRRRKEWVNLKLKEGKLGAEEGRVRPEGGFEQRRGG